MSTSIPVGRGRWRLTLHRRQFADASWQSTILGELTQARGRNLAQQLNGSATLTFTINGRTETASLIQELAMDVIAWRWSEALGHDVPYFRGIIAQSEDQLSESDHVVTFTCHDYFAMLARRFVTATTTFNNTDQDAIVTALVLQAKTIRSTPGTTTFTPGSYLPLVAQPVNGDGSVRGGPSGQLRTRSYPGSSQIDQMIDQLAHVIGGFDYDVVPGWRFGANPNTDALRVFYPSQGVTRAEPVLEYGGRIASLTRSVNSGNYANFERYVGQKPDANPATAQLYSEQWNTDSNNITVTPVGLWMDAQSAPDVSVQATLDQQAQGELSLNGVLVPTYTLKLKGDTYHEGLFNVGDILPIVVNSGRLKVNTTLRLVGLTFDIGDDGQEDVAITVGRPPNDLVSLLTATDADVNALARR